MSENFECGPDGCNIDFDEEKVSEETKNEKDTESVLPILVTTKTCPNCREIKEYFANKGIEYEEMYVEDNQDKVIAMGIMSAPTLVLPDGTKLVGQSDIRGYYNS